MHMSSFIDLLGLDLSLNEVWRFGSHGRHMPLVILKQSITHVSEICVMDSM